MHRAVLESSDLARLEHVLNYICHDFDIVDDRVRLEAASRLMAFVHLGIWNEVALLAAVKTSLLRAPPKGWIPHTLAPINRHLAQRESEGMEDKTYGQCNIEASKALLSSTAKLLEGYRPTRDRLP